ncbi:MAG: hypothetical protein ACRC2T_08985 [Thermoguttaceae bacterium]
MVFFFAQKQGDIRAAKPIFLVRLGSQKKENAASLLSGVLQFQRGWNALLGDWS